MPVGYRIVAPIVVHRQWGRALRCPSPSGDFPNSGRRRSPGANGRITPRPSQAVDAVRGQTIDNPAHDVIGDAASARPSSHETGPCHPCKNVRSAFLSTRSAEAMIAADRSSREGPDAGSGSRAPTISGR